MLNFLGNFIRLYQTVGVILLFWSNAAVSILCFVATIFVNYKYEKDTTVFSAPGAIRFFVTLAGFVGYWKFPLFKGPITFILCCVSIVFIVIQYILTFKYNRSKQERTRSFISNLVKND